SFYGYLRERLGIDFGDADERLETVLATPREALLIGTPGALPMLLLHRLSRDTDGRPLERVRSLYRGDRFSFTTHLAPGGDAWGRPSGTRGETSKESHARRRKRHTRCRHTKRRHTRHRHTRRRHTRYGHARHGRHTRRRHARRNRRRRRARHHARLARGRT